LKPLIFNIYEIEKKQRIKLTLSLPVTGFSLQFKTKNNNLIVNEISLFQNVLFGIFIQI